MRGAANKEVPTMSHQMATPVDSGNNCASDQPPPMTAETRAFFAREDVRAFVDKVRSVAPEATFAMHEEGDGVRYFIGNRHGWNSYPTNWGISLHVISEGLLGEDAERHRGAALRSGRALIDQDLPASDEAGTPSEEPQPSRPVSSLRPVCACGQTAWSDSLDYDGKPICSDCIGDKCAAAYGHEQAPLAARLALAQAETKVPYGDVGPWDARDAEYEL